MSGLIIADSLPPCQWSCARIFNRQNKICDHLLNKYRVYDNYFIVPIKKTVDSIVSIRFRDKSAIKIAAEMKLTPLLKVSI